MSIEAMKQWREALACALSDDKPYIDRCKQAIESIDQAIDAASQLPEAEKQEHVVWVHAGSFDAMIEAGAGYSYIYPSKRIGASKPLYTHPQPKREWVGLAPEDMNALVEQAREVPAEVPCPDYNKRLLTLANAKLKEKNT